MNKAKKTNKKSLNPVSILGFFLILEDFRQALLLKKSQSSFYPGVLSDEPKSWVIGGGNRSLNPVSILGFFLI